MDMVFIDHILHCPAPSLSPLEFIPLMWNGEKERASAPGSSLRDSPYPSYEWKVPKIPFSELYLSLWLLKKTSVVPVWDGKGGLRWHRPCGAWGLERTQLWVTDACSPVLMWPACETMAPQYYTKVHASYSLGNNSQPRKSFLEYIPEQKVLSQDGRIQHEGSGWC